MVSKYARRACCLVSVLSISNCIDVGKKNELDPILSIDSNAVRDFLKDPRVSLEPTKLKFETNCDLNENQNPLALPIAKRKYYNCEYTHNGKRIATMESSILETDSTWVLGTNGFQLHHFETNTQIYPLKKGLEIGLPIEDFMNVFGQPQKIGNVYTYNFKFTSFSSILMLKCSDNLVSTITIINSYSPEL